MGVEAGWWTTSGNIGLPPLARVMGVGRQQQQQASNVLYDMERVWAVLGSGDGARGCGGVLQVVQIQSLSL